MPDQGQQPIEATPTASPEITNTGFALTQPAASFGYRPPLMENATLARLGPNPAVRLINQATDRVPNLAISDSYCARAPLEMSRRLSRRR